MTERTPLTPEFLSQIAKTSSLPLESVQEIQTETAKLPPIPVPESRVNAFDAREKELQEQRRLLAEERKQFDAAIAQYKALVQEPVSVPEPQVKSPATTMATRLEYLEQQVRETQEQLRRKDQEAQLLRLKELISTQAQTHDYDLINELDLHDRVIGYLQNQHISGQTPNIEEACHAVCEEEITKAAKISKSKFLNKLAANQEAQAKSQSSAPEYKTLTQQMAPVVEPSEKAMQTPEGRRAAALNYVNQAMANNPYPGAGVQVHESAHSLGSGFPERPKTKEQKDVEERRQQALKMLQQQMG